MARLLKSLVAAGLALPWLAGAAGLGQLNVLSSLGQPLHAEIDILAASKEDIANLIVRLAPAEAYRQANMDYGPALSGVGLSIQQRSGGQPFVRVSSSAPVNEPFVNLLIELNWPSGKLVREYAVLLDPPGYAGAPPVAAPVAAAESRPPAGVRPSSAAVAPTPPAGSQYGPVKRGETLSKIAAGMRAESVSLEQVMMAILIANPEAFIGNNINRLKAGVTLRIPDQQQVASVTPDKARQDVRVQTGDWNRYRRRLADAAGGSTESAAQPRKRAAVRVTEGEDKGGKDVLKLSAGQSAGGKARSSTERIQTLEEELVARDRALNEANARIKQLEKAAKDVGDKK